MLILEVRQRLTYAGLVMLRLVLPRLPVSLPLQGKGFDLTCISWDVLRLSLAASVLGLVSQELDCFIEA